MKKERCHLWREVRGSYQPALMLMVAGTERGKVLCATGQTLLHLPEGKLGFAC